MDKSTRIILKTLGASPAALDQVDKAMLALEGPAVVEATQRIVEMAMQLPAMVARLEDERREARLQLDRIERKLDVLLGVPGHPVSPMITYERTDA